MPVWIDHKGVPHDRDDDEEWQEGRRPEDVDDGFRQIAQNFRESPTIAVAETAVRISGNCESPIEVTLASWLIQKIEANRLPLIVATQYRLERFRFDLAIYEEGSHVIPALLIECDGLEFHSSPKQRENDARKDEAAKKSGIRLVRFTGKEIFRNYQACADAILHMLGY